MIKDILRQAVEQQETIEVCFVEKGREIEHEIIGIPYRLDTDSVRIRCTGSTSNSISLNDITSVTILPGSPSLVGYTSEIKHATGWIQSSEVQNYDVQRYGMIGGCVMTDYIVTTEGDMYLIRPE